jgi:hypothetical protein
VKRLASGRAALATAVVITMMSLLSAPGALAVPAAPETLGTAAVPGTATAVDAPYPTPPVEPTPGSSPTPQPTAGPTPTMTPAPTAPQTPAPTEQPSPSPGGAAENPLCPDPEPDPDPGYGPTPPPVDCPVAIDFGDAPDSYGTRVPNGGPGHVLTSILRPDEQLTMGLHIDEHEDGIPTTAADGDDFDQPIDDEDAMRTGAVFDILGTRMEIPVVNTTGAPATLAAWIDLNLNGRFDAVERAVARLEPETTTATLAWEPSIIGTLDVPLRPGSRLASYARLRLYPEVISEPMPTGSALVLGGEVEDHRIFVVQAAANGELPVTGDTGSRAVRIVLGGLGLLGCGAVAVAMARRRPIIGG